MIRTFVDSGVLYARFRGKTEEVRDRAAVLLRSEDRIFLASPFLVLESLPHAEREGRSNQVTYLQGFFSRCEAIDDLEAIARTAREIIMRRPLALVEALHLAAAYLLDGDEFITTEGKRRAQGAAFYDNGFIRVTRFQ